MNVNQARLYLSQKGFQPGRTFPANIKTAINLGNLAMLNTWLTAIQIGAPQMWEYQLKKIELALYKIHNDPAFKEEKEKALLSINTSLQRTYASFGYKTGPEGHLDAYGSFRATQRTFKITVADKDLFNRLFSTQASPEMRASLFSEAIGEFRQRLPKVLKDSFNDATIGLEEGAFPKKYIANLNKVIDANLDKIIAEGNSAQEVSITVGNFFQALGTMDDLERGYHYAAAVATEEAKRESKKQSLGKFIWMGDTYSIQGKAGSWVGYRSKKGVFMPHKPLRRVTLPWSAQSQPLRTPNRFTRYKYWSAMYKGDPSVKIDYLDIKGARKTRDIPVIGSFKETVDARLEFWNTHNIAPYWLLLDYGQTQFKPIIPKNKPAKRVRKGSWDVGTGMLPWNYQFPDNTIIQATPQITAASLRYPGNVTSRFVYYAATLWTELLISKWIRVWNKVNAYKGKGYYPPEEGPHPNEREGNQGIFVQSKAPEGYALADVRQPNASIQPDATWGSAVEVFRKTEAITNDLIRGL